jgi:phosphoribosylaminoimidazolecarboxamide formyltransferase/IMP cyclohydrolase
MSSEKKIGSALISVYHKEGLEPIVRRLHELGVTLYSTGGTQEFIGQLGLPVIPVEQLTNYPSILGGRVKTLHPKVFGGILNRREHEHDVAEVAEFAIPSIDLVVVDLYPFEQTVASGAGEQEIIEKIDIGGISLIRAGAKNFNDVLIVPSRDLYADLLRILESRAGVSTLEDRRRFAAQAFLVSSHYDTAIFQYFNRTAGIPAFAQSLTSVRSLRYGENPHQQASFFGDFSAFFDQVHGKEISYNNLLDIDAAVALIAEFDEPTFAILKHNNACGVASRELLADAWKAALAGDPVSAFGGILVCNREVNEQVAQSMHELFFEVCIAPAYSSGALDILKQKKNRIILIQKQFSLPPRQFRTILNGVVEQDRDVSTETAEQMKPMTRRVPDTEALRDLVFANKVVKHTKSNTIVLAKDRQLLASGTGQTSRVDALQQAIAKARHFGFSLDGAVMASDAFFPFPDCVQIAFEAGIRSVVQPGGSIKDQESVDYCEAHDMAMVMTGIRHFKH